MLGKEICEEASSAVAALLLVDIPSGGVDEVGVVVVVVV